MEVQEKNQTEQSKFPVFSFRNEEMLTDYRVIINKTDSKVLVPEYKQADYLLMIQGSIPFSEKGAILRKVKAVTFIQTAFEIDPTKIKSKENFVF